MALLDCQFYVLRIMVSAPVNDQILDSSCNEQFVFINEAQVSCAEKWTFTCIGQISVESVFRLLHSAPVSLRHTCAGHPDFSDLIRGTAGQSRNINDGDFLIWA